MQYPVRELKELALREGFTAAERLNTDALVFLPEVREMCRADKCRAYGKKLALPARLRQFGRGGKAGGAVFLRHACADGGAHGGRL